MTDSEVMLRRQAQWQKDRCSLSWPEKIRMAERVRGSAERLRDRSNRARPQTLSLSGSAPTAIRRRER